MLFYHNLGYAHQNLDELEQAIKIYIEVYEKKNQLLGPDNIDTLDDCKRIQLANSDVVSFHSYGDPPSLERCLVNLATYDRPLLCTEFMARPNGSVFDPHLRMLRDHGVAAYCWGFVNGKSQTIYPWDSWTKSYDAPPPVWFHDILEPDGTPFSPVEVDAIRSVTGRK